MDTIAIYTNIFLEKSICFSRILLSKFIKISQITKITVNTFVVRVNNIM
jgi:hypothetical protein